jgi:hypothetical protein
VAELGRDRDTLAWALRGIAETGGWQTGKLYDLACAIYACRDEHVEALALTPQHERTPTVAPCRRGAPPQERP